MRELFSEYYQPSKEEFTRLWQEATFVFDTNVLLNLYRYTASTRDDLLRILEQLQARIWLPYHVGFEFSRKREFVIIEQNQIFDLIDHYNKFVEEKFTNTIVQKNSKRGHFFADLEKIQSIFDQTRQALQDELEQARKQQPDPMNEDPIIERLDIILRGKIGQPYSSKEMAQMALEFEERYKQRIPPGFKDETKNKSQPGDDPANPANKYGDVIIWYQIIEYAKQENHPIIFVVDDIKEDWWQMLHGKKRGPRRELRLEMREKANVLFYTYTADTFLQRARDFLQLQAQQATIEEIRKSRKDEERQAALQSRLYPGPNVYSSPTLYPEARILDSTAIRQLREIQRTLDLLGGPKRLMEQVRVQANLLRYISPFVSNGLAIQDESAVEDDQEPGPEESESEDETQQNQEDLPSDDTSDD